MEQTNMDPLARQIKDAAYLEGEFTLRSGQKSNYYLDKYLFETQPAILRELGKRFEAFVTPEVDLIAGAELGGVPLAAAVAMQIGKPFVIVRNKKKDYGTAKPYEGPDPQGKTILLVEDIATTGGQVIEAAKTLTELGAKIRMIVATIDRLQGARENIEKEGFAFDTIFTKADLGIA